MSTTMTAPATGHDQVAGELAILDLLLEREVGRLRHTGLYVDNEFRGLYVADEQVDRLLRPAGGHAPSSDRLLGETIATRRARLADAEEAARATGNVLPLALLEERCGLDAVDRQLLVIALAAELDLRYEQLFAYAHNDVTRKRPTVELALRLLADDLCGRAAVRAHLTPDAPLLRHRLVNVGQEPQERDPSPFLTRPLGCDRRIAEWVLGVDALDERLAPFTAWSRRARALDDLPLRPDVRDALPGLAAQLRERGAIVGLEGSYGSGRSSLAAALAATLGRPLLVAGMRGALREVSCCIGTVFALLAREARLTGAALLLTDFELLFEDEALAGFRSRAVATHLARAGVPVFLSTRTPWHPPRPWPDCPVLRLRMGPAGYHERVRAWGRALDGARVDADVDPGELASKFGLTPGQVDDAVRDARDAAWRRDPQRPEVDAEDLHAAARAQSAHALGRFAQRVETRRTWDDLVVTGRVVRQLREIERHVRYRDAVLATWGFDQRLSMSRGVNVLFAGPSGTGKTLAAEILAGQLRLELFKVDLASVVSKYIGDTEKQLDLVFRAAHDSNAIVFFDEADATFGKRSEVGDAHDRYANIEVAYLLQKIEEYEGVVILATNLRRNMDDAFARRMQHTVEFALPRASERRRILDLLLGPVPVADDVDLDFLAERFELSGGNLRNIAVAAAFLAAEEDSRITMRHLVLATAREFEKTSRLPSRSDFGPYHALLHEFAVADR